MSGAAVTRKRGARASLKRWLPQVAVVLAVVGLVAWLFHNVTTNLARRGIMMGFDFLDRAARFPISESALDYSPVDSFARAFLVGMTNTLFISLLVIVCSTALGFLVALGRRSSHLLASGVATVYVEASRNTPLVVQLLFWYAVVTFGLPPVAQALNPANGVYLTERGLYLPRLSFDNVALPLAVTVIGLGAAVAGWIHSRRKRLVAGRAGQEGFIAAALGLALAVLIWPVSNVTISVEYPALGRFNFMGGLTLTPEFVAILLGLTLYSTAFVAEIVRGGIGAVARGQWEAARALGLDERRVLRLIVLPQALRVIIPPMTSQYINIVKNSTLALVVGYPELNFVTATSINQTGQAIEGIGILMLSFLLISASASLLMNWYNRRMAIPQR
jgi:general L-amino acid transport system permease protein